MATAAELLRIAAAEIGTAEDPAGSNNTKYCEWYGFKDKWCGMFVSWCCDQAGLTLKGIQNDLGFAKTSLAVTWFKKHDRWLDADGTPRPGDLVFFDRNHDIQSDHVGLVEEVLADGTLKTIEGNASDQVKRRTYPTRATVLGFGRLLANDTDDTEDDMTPDEVRAIVHEELEPLRGALDVLTRKRAEHGADPDPTHISVADVYAAIRQIQEKLGM